MKTAKNEPNQISWLGVPVCTLTGPQPHNHRLTRAWHAAWLLVAALCVTISAGRSLAQPTITAPLRDQTNAVGTTAALCVQAAGTLPLSYQWRYHISLLNFTNMPGETNACLVLTNVQQMNRRFSVEVSNAAGTVVTQAVVRVGYPVVITQQPTNTTVEEGMPATLSVTASGTAPLSYQWYFNDTLMPGQTSSEISFNSAQTNNAGLYHVTVQNNYAGTNLFGGQTSRVARLRVFPPGSSFTPISDGPVVNDPGSYWGSAWVDIDQDGYIDLFVTMGGNNYSGANRLYRNTGGGTFTSMTTNQVGPIVGDVDQWWGCGWGDYDNNGYPDLYVASWASALYRNLGGTFERVDDAGPGGVQGGATVWFDYDRDGWVDLFDGRAWGSGGYHNTLFHNGGDGGFTAVTSGPIWGDPATRTEKAAWGDYDGDGWPDLVVTDLGALGTLLYRNLSGGNFLRVTGNAITQNPGTCPVWADYDNDGRLDLLMGSGLNPLRLYHNETNGQFTMVLLGDSPSGPSAWGDYDNDGDLDLFVSRGQIADWRNRFFQNNGDGTFTEIMTIAPATFSGRSGNPIWGDYDNDGRLDLFVPHLQTWGTSLLYHNNGNISNHWVMIKAVGSRSNRSAIGARARVLATIFGKRYWQMRDIGSSNGGDAQNDPRAHFGLGDATNVETLRIEWPSGQVTEMHNVASKQILTVTEPPRMELMSMKEGKFEFQLSAHIGMAWDLHASSHVHGFDQPCTNTDECWKPLISVTNTSRTITVCDSNCAGASVRFYKPVAKQAYGGGWD